MHVVNDYQRFYVKRQNTETHSASLINMAQGYYNGSTNLQYRVIIVMVAQIRPADNIPLVPTSTSNGGDGGLNILRCRERVRGHGQADASRAQLPDRLHELDVEQ
jgi:hypothetical protein